MKKTVACTVLATIAVSGVGMTMADSASASALPSQRAAVAASLSAPTVLSSGEQPQFLSVLADDAVKVAATVNATKVTYEATKKVVSKTKAIAKKIAPAAEDAAEVTAEESSSSSSGIPVTSPASQHGAIPGDAQFDAQN
jgi:type IV secretory pathway protease TraF